MRMADVVLTAFLVTFIITTVVLATELPLEPARGEAQEGLQLSLAANQTAIKLGGKLTLRLWAKNLSAEVLKLDAKPPIYNGSGLIITDPEGKQKTVQYWADKPMPLVLPPGETDFGVHEATQHIGEWQFDPKAPPGKQALIPKAIPRGVYRIQWKLHHTVSNTVQVTVKNEFWLGVQGSGLWVRPPRTPNPEPRTRAPRGYFDGRS